jgi:type IV pilus assembly protein PilV
MMVKQQQRGFLVIEALIAILIFSLGILGLVAMGSTAIGAQSDARFRTDAAALADEMAGLIAVTAARSTTPLFGAVDPVLQLSLASFAHQTTGVASAAACNFSGGAGNLLAQNWAAGVVGGPRRLPGATAANQQILVNTAAFNQVTITLCWQGPNDQAIRRHTLVTYIN